MAASGTTAYAQIGHSLPVITLAVYNAGSTAIPVNSRVILDSSNLLDNTDVRQICVALATTTTTPSRTIGSTLTEIPAYSEGTIGCAGVLEGVCKGTITAGSEVANSIAAGYTGNIATAVANYPSCGIALTTGADTDTIPYLCIPSATTITGSTMGT